MTSYAKSYSTRLPTNDRPATMSRMEGTALDYTSPELLSCCPSVICSTVPLPQGSCSVSLSRHLPSNSPPPLPLPSSCNLFVSSSYFSFFYSSCLCSCQRFTICHFFKSAHPLLPPLSFRLLVPKPLPLVPSVLIFIPLQLRGTLSSLSPFQSSSFSPAPFPHSTMSTGTPFTHLRAIVPLE